MKSEDLFLAIGEVEGSRLLRSELTVQEPSAVVCKEEPVMKKKRANPGRIIRNSLVAAILISMLGVTAYAVGGFLIFDSPEEMVASIFGDKTGYDHSDGSITPFEDGINVIIEPTYDRVPVDEEVAAQEAAPLVNAVGQSISWEGYTLTIDANLYDSVTKCGLVTYTLENPEGVNYSLQSTGEVWFPQGEIVKFSQYGYSYIIQKKSTDTKLAATYYYQLRDKESTDLEITFTQWASITQEQIDQRIEEIKQELRQEIPEEEALAFQKEYVGDSWPWFEENRTREENIDSAYEAWAYQRLEEFAACPDKITIPAVSSGEMTNVTLGNGAVILSPVAIIVNIKEIENFPRSFVDLTKIVFADGTEYVVKDGYTLNYVFNVGNADGSETTFMFNRVIDVNEVTSVIVDGNIELTVD